MYQPTCQGCYVQTPNVWPPFPYQEPFSLPFAPLTFTWPVATAALTQQERDILAHLAKAFEEWVKLQEKGPDDDTDFVRTIHQAQQLIALRVARRVDPAIWKTYEKGE